MRNLFQQITDEIIAAIEAGAGDYVMPWHAGAAGVPANVVSGRLYRGINTLLLWAQAKRLGYQSGQWATYRQWSEVGAQVRKGEAAATVLFWKGVGADTDNDGDDRAAPARFIARAFRVFNADQVDGFNEGPVAVLADQDRIDHADRFFKQLPATVWYGSSYAFYDPRADMVSMPDFASFKSPEGFYTTLAHELVHWSGANHRLGRDLKNRFGSEAYAMEELIALSGQSAPSATLQ
jgi:antirestriction protein ArdC